MGKLTHKLFTRFIFKKPFYGVSIVAQKRLKFMTSLIEKIIYEDVEGELIECGVYRGGSLIKMGLKLKSLNSMKVVYGLDTFEGHPYSDKGTIHKAGMFSDTSEKGVQNVINKFQLNDNVCLLKGKFVDLFLVLKQHKFCFAHIDCDLYLSHKQCLKFLLPRMAKGSIIYFDDYNAESTKKFCNRAVEKFISVNDLIILPDNQAYYIIK